MTTLVVIGTGLIGGSVALAARRKNLFDQILGFDLDEHCFGVAMQRGICDDRFEIGDNADAICVAVPASAIASSVQTLADSYNEETVIFDVGSVKQSVIQALKKPPSNFVPCHPIAGSEKSGASAATNDLFDRATCVITPTQHTDSQSKERVKAIWEALGSRVVEMTPLRHDQALGLTSHLPHLLSMVVVEMLADDTSSSRELMGNGLRDFSRIAAIDEKIWTDIFSANIETLEEQVEVVIHYLHDMLRLAKTEPELLQAKLAKIRTFRQSIYD